MHWVDASPCAGLVRAVFCDGESRAKGARRSDRLIDAALAAAVQAAALTTSPATVRQRFAAVNARRLFAPVGSQAVTRYHYQ